MTEQERETLRRELVETVLCVATFRALQHRKMVDSGASLSSTRHITGWVDLRREFFDLLASDDSPTPDARPAAARISTLVHGGIGLSTIGKRLKDGEIRDGYRIHLMKGTHGHTTLRVEKVEASHIPSCSTMTFTTVPAQLSMLARLDLACNDPEAAMKLCRAIRAGLEGG